MPAPVCKDQDYTFDAGIDSVVPITRYLGNASSDGWVSSGQPEPYVQQLLLTLPQNSVGTLVSSAAYVWYGKVTVTMKTSAGAGVVTSFLLYADSKDEINFEFDGAELERAQTSFYSQGFYGKL